jgi:hypothetical protein
MECTTADGIIVNYNVNTWRNGGRAVHCWLAVLGGDIVKCEKKGGMIVARCHLCGDRIGADDRVDPISRRPATV